MRLLNSGTRLAMQLQKLQRNQLSMKERQEYDYVFDIELDEGSPVMRKLKLPYNKNTDPYLAADDFLNANELPSCYLDQVCFYML
ncbi:hypothetical protein EMCRGX_G020593 [Ephydatia muelleri]